MGSSTRKVVGAHPLHHEGRAGVPDLIKLVLWCKNEEHPTTARCARKTKKRPVDYRATGGTQRHEETSQSIQKYPALLAIEF